MTFSRLLVLDTLVYYERNTTSNNNLLEICFLFGYFSLEPNAINVKINYAPYDGLRWQKHTLKIVKADDSSQSQPLVEEVYNIKNASREVMEL